MINYWLFIKTRNRYAKETTKFTEQILLNSFKIGKWPVGSGTPHKTKVKPGDQVIVYYSKHFIANFQITSRYRALDISTKNLLSNRNDQNYCIDFNEPRFFSAPVYFREVQIFLTPHGIRRITKPIFERIMSKTQTFAPKGKGAIKGVIIKARRMAESQNRAYNETCSN